MRRKLLVPIIIVTALVGALLALVAYQHWRVLGVHVTEVTFEVVDAPHIGFNAGTDKVYFGRVMRGGGATREVLLSSAVAATAYVEASDDLRGWVIPDRRTVDIGAGETVRLTLALDVPEDAPVGNYTGTVVTTYFRR